MTNVLKLADGTADIQDYLRDFDVQDHRNVEAVASAELDLLAFRVKRHIVCGSAKPNEVDALVAAAVKATIATARRMKREEELRRYEKAGRSL
jgi:hypothetical protein